MRPIEFAGQRPQIYARRFGPIWAWVLDYPCVECHSWRGVHRHQAVRSSWVEALQLLIALHRKQRERIPRWGTPEGRI